MLDKQQIVIFALVGIVGSLTGFLVGGIVTTTSSEYMSFRLYMKFPEQSGLYVYTLCMGAIFALSYAAYAVSRNMRGK